MRTTLSIFILSLCFCNLKIYSQTNIAINNTGFPPHPTAMLDISSFDQGLLIPRMEGLVKWTILNPAEGLIVCDTTSKSLWMYANGNWEELAMKYNTHFTNEFGIIHNIGNLTSDDFVFGSPKLDDDGIPDHRKRFFFDKSKAAFRAGQVYDAGSTAMDDESKRWDADSVGFGSMALGINTMASNSYSVAIGGNAVARGYGSVAIGNTVSANGTAAVALGITEAIGDRSFSAGSTNKAIGYGSMALGELTNAKGKLSTSMGTFTKSDAFTNLAIGRFNVGGGDSSNWVLTDPIFEIGNAPDLASRQNAFTVLKGGTMISGSHQVDDDPTRTSDNKRMYFDKSKAAFRAGELYDAGSTVSDDESKRWDADSVGVGSIALGTNTMAKNYYSVAIGGNAVATGHGAVAIGNTVTAHGAASVAIGISEAVGDRSFSSGSTNKAIGYGSTAMGELTNAKGKLSSSMGAYTKSDAYVNMAIGRFNVGGGDSSNWVLTDPIFEIGNAPDLSGRQNAFTVLKGGTMISGSHQVDDDPTRISDNRRMFFHRAQGAFRSGGAEDDPMTAFNEDTNFDRANLGDFSAAFGLNTTASNYGSFAVGIGSIASDTASTAMGKSSATGTFSTALGVAKAQSFGGVAVGIHNYGGGSPLSWVNTDPLFEVGNGTLETPSNAFTVLKNGRTGINTHFPQTMLHIEQPNSGIGNGILLHLSEHGHWETSVTTNSDYNFYFNNNLRAHLTEQGTFHLPENLGAGLLTDGNLVIGQTTGKNVSIDNNEIMARNNGGPDELLLQKNGGWVGIGTSPMSTLDINGNFALGTNYAGSLTAPPNGAIIEGYVGIGTHYPYNRLDVSGNLAIGSSYAGSATFAPTNGAIVEGSMGIGTSVVQNKLDVEGGVAIGSAFSGTAPGPAEGAAIQGSVGIGVLSPTNKLDVSGNVAIGSTYSGSASGPINGAAIEGSVGIGTFSPTNKLDVNGKITVSEATGDEMVIINGPLYGHAIGRQEFGFDGPYFMMASKEESSESSGIYGDGNYVTIWASGIEERLVRFLDQDHFDSADTDPYNNNAEVAFIDENGNYHAVSDATLKRDVEKIDHAIDKINQINGYTYTFRKNENEIGRKRISESQSGVLAQEVEKVIPEAVSKNESGQYFVNYDALIPVLIEGLKEQQATIEELQKKIEKLEKKL